jgi:hypothetical protein
LRPAARGRVSQPKQPRLRFVNHRRRVGFSAMIRAEIQRNLTKTKRRFHEHLCACNHESEGHKVAGEWPGFGGQKLGLKVAGGDEAFNRPI